MADETIFALSSGRPPAAIAVLRLSGPQAFAAAAAMAGDLPAPREARLRTLRDATGAALDQALVITFPGPATATGEDLIELHCHGGRAVVAAVERALAAQPGLRPAVAGEFTRRALEHGRIDLAEAQGLADLLAAETDAARRAAMARADGHLSRALRDWLDRLSMIAALIEAELDFDDESDVVVDRSALTTAIDTLIVDVAAMLARPVIERLDEGFTVVLTGPPNSGKSSLLNAMLMRDAAIVSPIAGTTRDRIEARVDRNGLAYRLIDTAGLREETDDAIERVGIDRAHQALAAADVIVWLDLEEPPADPRILPISARADERAGSSDRLAVSVRWSDSIERLWAVIEERARVALIVETPTLDRTQRDVVVELPELLRKARAAADTLLAAEYVRAAHRSVGSLLGIDHIDSMLDALFRRFCIGK